MTIEYIDSLLNEQHHVCAISGMPIHLSSEKRRSKDFCNTASLDRIDSKMGYELGNVQWVHKDVNLMKNYFSNEYFISVCKLISAKNK